MGIQLKNEVSCLFSFLVLDASGVGLTGIFRRGIVNTNGSQDQERMDHMTVRFGILGLGVISNRFATVLDGLEGAVLQAAASRELARSEEFIRKHHGKKAYDSYDALIKDPEVDILYIGLTHNFHYEFVKKCLENGKAVLCEKPLVLHGQQAAELIELSHKNNVLLMEAMWTRCIPAFQKAREWVKSGRIGKPSFVDASFCFHVPFNPENRLYNPELAGGSLYDAGVYPIEFAIGILDEAPVGITGVANLCATGVDDFAAMSFHFGSGALASLSCGFTANTSQDAVIYGSGGKIIVRGFLGSKKSELFNAQGELVEVFEDEFEDGFRFQIQHVCKLFTEGKIESNLIPHKDTLACANAFDELMKQFHV